VNPLEQQLLRELSGPTEPVVCLRTSTKVDTGRWWRRSPAWLCVVGSELLTFAVARRRFVSRIPLAECAASHYHHASGQLVLAPAENLPVRRFSMPLRDALQMLPHLQIDDKQ
jgi:hypothetical protein